LREPCPVDFPPWNGYPSERMRTACHPKHVFRKPTTSCAWIEVKLAPMAMTAHQLVIVRQPKQGLEEELRVVLYGGPL